MHNCITRIAGNGTAVGAANTSPVGGIKVNTFTARSDSRFQLLGLENSVSDGIISGFRDGPKGTTWVQTTAPVSHGNSGGPLLTMDEKVAGVVTWKVDAGENLNFAAPSKLIARLLIANAITPFGSKSETNSTPATASTDQIRVGAVEASTKVCNVGVYIAPLTEVPAYEAQARLQSLIRAQHELIAELQQAALTHDDVQIFESADDEKSDVQIILSFSVRSGQGEGLWFRDGENEGDKHRLNAWYEKLKGTPEQLAFMKTKGWDLQERPLSTGDVLHAVNLWHVHGSHSARKAPPRRVNAVYDKFKDYTVVKTDDMDIWKVGSSGLHFVVYYGCDGKTEDCRPSSLGILFSMTSPEWSFKRSSRSVIFLVDDSRMSLGEADWDGDVLGGNFVEQMTIHVSPAQLATLARGVLWLPGHFFRHILALSGKSIQIVSMCKWNDRTSETRCVLLP